MKLIKLENYDLDTDSMLDVSSIPSSPIKISNTVENGYVDISSAENWDKYGHLFMDFLFVRDEINSILFLLANPSYPTINFAGWFNGNITSSQKQIMAKYILAPYALRLTVQTEEEDKGHWYDLLNISQGTGSIKFTGRALIVEKMRKSIAEKVRKETMTMATSQQFFKDVDAMLNWYINTASPDFKWWLSNASGTAYENNGFEQKSYWTQSIEDELLSIYNGQDYVS